MLNREIYTKSFIGLLFANMFFWMSVNFFLPVLPIYYHTLGMNDHQVGLAIGAFSIGGIIFRLISGKAVDRCGSVPVITVGIIISVGAIISYYFSVSMTTITLSRFLHGMGISGYSAAALTMTTLMQEERNATEAVAIYTLFTMFGIGIAASSAGWIYSQGDLPLVIGAGVGATVLSFLLFPRRPRLKNKPVAAQSLPLRQVIINPGVYVPTVSLLAVNICYGSVMTFLPLLLVSRGVNEFSFFYAAYAVAVIFSRVWVSKLCSWFTPERLAIYILLIMAGSVSLTGYTSAWWALASAGATVGVGYGLAFPTLTTIITNRVHPSNRGTAYGFYTMAVDGGLAIGAIGMGSVASLWGYAAVFYTAAVYTITYTAIYVLLLKPKLLLTINSEETPLSEEASGG